MEDFSIMREFSAKILSKIYHSISINVFFLKKIYTVTK